MDKEKFDIVFNARFDNKMDAYDYLHRQIRIVDGMHNVKCKDCNDRGWLYDEDGNRRGICPCHYQ